MKTLALILILLVSCESVENVGLDGLSSSDKEYIRGLGRKKCLSQTESVFKSFQNDSNSKLSDFKRKQKWTLKLALADITTTAHIHIWKVTSSALYILQETPTSSDSDYKFIKITKDMNTALIQNIRTSLCSDDMNDATIEFTNSNPPKVKEKQFFAGTAEKTRRRRLTEYLFSSKRPAYFGSLTLSIAERTVKDTSESDADKPNPKSYKTVETYIAEAEFLHDNYEDYTTANYCVVNVPTVFDLPYTLDCVSTPNAGPTGWTSPDSDL